MSRNAHEPDPKIYGKLFNQKRKDSLAKKFIITALTLPLAIGLIIFVAMALSSCRMPPPPEKPIDPDLYYTPENYWFECINGFVHIVSEQGQVSLNARCVGEGKAFQQTNTETI